MWELVTDTEAENAAASRAQRQAASLSCCLRRVVGEQRVGMGPPRRELQCLYLDHPTPHPAVQNTPRQGTAHAVKQNVLLWRNETAQRKRPLVFNPLTCLLSVLSEIPLLA